MVRRALGSLLLLALACGPQPGEGEGGGAQTSESGDAPASAEATGMSPPGTSSTTSTSGSTSTTTTSADTSGEQDSSTSEPPASTSDTSTSDTAADDECEPPAELPTCADAMNEADTALEAIGLGALAYFMAEHPYPPDDQVALHRCPHPVDAPEGGTSGATPGLNLDCNAAPCNRCVPARGNGDPGSYVATEWTEDNVWLGIGFAMTEPHVLHYEFAAENELAGYGACTFTITARGDLDGDFIFSTFTRTGTFDQQIGQIGPLEAEDPCE